MKRTRFILFLVASFLASPLFAAPDNNHTAMRLRVLLQGESAAALRVLVEKNGGIITHDLPIINAVGVRVSQRQLTEILQSKLVKRHIDDLAVSDKPDTAPESDCDVGGSLELETSSTGFKWTLFNKRETPVRLKQLILSWSESLGDIKSLTVDKQLIDRPLYGAGQNGRMEINFEEESAPAIGKSAKLHASFARPDRERAFNIQQQELSLEAGFFGGCSTQLIPGYRGNSDNPYFPRVAGASALHTQGITGKGVTVAIIDSGLWEHQALTHNTSGRQRVIARYDAINHVVGDRLFDESGHGTHMTSVLAHSGEVKLGNQPTGTFKGIAPDVNLVAVKAFDIEGQGDFLDIVRAIQFVVDQRDTYNIKVLNLSFAAKPRWNYWQDPINQAVMRAWASGITVVAAAGNEGPDPITVGSPGNLPYLITVGAVTDSWTPDLRDDDYVPDFSSQGPTPNAHIKPDIVAPGGHIAGITRPGSRLTQDFPEYLLKTGEFVMTGTSQASALVSGIVALLLQLEPDLSPDDVKCILTTSAEPAINRDNLLAYSPFQQGNGYVSATRAVTLGQRGCGNEGLNIHRDIAGLEHFQGPAIVEQDGTISLPGLGKLHSQTPTEKGLSKSRKWGVKAHIERKNYQWDEQRSTAATHFDWQLMYAQEKAKMEELARQPQENKRIPGN
ncbi:MAG: S8 family peptidase [Halieaceae bacterium]|jgi:serine protease AprX|nr:S8 family peptidase [Halieaceae bacterium]